MSGISFLADNLYDDADVILTTGAENAQFPLTNLKNDSPSVKFRSVGSTAVLEIDLLVTRDIQYVAIAADPGAGFLISSASFKTSATNDFSLSTVHNIDLSSQQTIGFKKIATVGHRYVEITLNGSGGFAEIGKIFIGEALNIPLNSLSIGSFKYGYKDQATIRRNKYGQKFINTLNKIKSLGGTIEFCTKDEQESIDDMLIEKGESYPIWMIVDEDSEAMNEGNFKLTIYGYVEGDLSWSAAGGQLYSTSINVVQAI